MALLAPPGRGRLRRIGKVLHVSRAGEIIIRAEGNLVPRIGDRVFGPDLKQVGVVADVFGPVASPYVAVRPLVDDPSRLVGRVLYVGGRRRRWRN